MTKGTLAAVVLWLSIATPEVARNPLAKLPPVPRPARASGELSTRLLVAHSVERAAVPPRPPALSPRSDQQ